MLDDSFYLTPEQMSRPYEETRCALLSFMWLHFIARGQPIYVALTELVLSPSVPSWVYEFVLGILFNLKREEMMILEGTSEHEDLTTLKGFCTGVQLKKEAKHEQKRIF